MTARASGKIRVEPMRLWSNAGTRWEARAVTVSCAYAMRGEECVREREMWSAAYAECAVEGRERERDLPRFRYGRFFVRSVFSRFTPREKCVPGEPIEVFTSKKKKNDLIEKILFCQEHSCRFIKRSQWGCPQLDANITIDIIGGGGFSTRGWCPNECPSYFGILF